MILKYAVPPPKVTREERERFRDPTDICQHEPELRKFVCANGAIQYRKQCVKCGIATTAIAHSKLTEQQKEKAPPFDRELERSVRDRAWTNWKADNNEYDKMRRWWIWYSQYLNSAVWQQKRKLVLKRANGICEACGIERAIQVHHLTYDNVGAEPLWDLVAVCDNCHKEFHKDAG